ncbi:Uncharacterised protein [Dermatophilus congolensis]|uniref:TadE-like domain-containing protein n=1 Tax=Dermatophilus congolensis TaxID=1863 RepID=A0AA46BQJ0_9MICO|nr:TadE family type IV pilus minor pilin [Dermatophilus congolensis]STD15797.1 Uncharacterised protein [Dermatophilus congolensis]
MKSTAQDLNHTNRRDAGYSTAELALATPAVMILVTVVAVLLGVLMDQVRCIDAARSGARALARGDNAAVAVRLAEQTAPTGSRISVARGKEMRVTVTAPARVAWVQQLHAGASASAPDESVGISGRRLGSVVLPTDISWLGQV